MTPSFGTDHHDSDTMETYLVSFGSDYKRIAHSVLGYWPELGQDAVLEVHATSKDEARDLTFALIGKEWCAIYGPTDPPGWEVLNLGSLADAVADPMPTDWTVGASVTVYAADKIDLNIEDIIGDLERDGAPPALTAGLSETLEFWRPVVSWVKREPSTP